MLLVLMPFLALVFGGTVGRGLFLLLGSPIAARGGHKEAKEGHHDNRATL
jgi:hypothetical protein